GILHHLREHGPAGSSQPAGSGRDGRRRGFPALELQACQNLHGRWRSDVPGVSDGYPGTEIAAGRLAASDQLAGARSHPRRHHFRYHTGHHLSVSSWIAAFCYARQRPCCSPTGESGPGPARRCADSVRLGRGVWSTRARCQPPSRGTRLRARRPDAPGGPNGCGHTRTRPLRPPASTLEVRLALLRAPDWLTASNPPSGFLQLALSLRLDILLACPPRYLDGSKGE